MVKTKINKISESFGAKRYDLPSGNSDFNAKLIDLEEEQNTVKSTLSLTKKNIEQKLVQF